KPMEKNKCYEFSIFLSRSEKYISQSRVTEEQANYITPAKIRIYGGFDYCDKQYLLGETKVVTNTRWIEYKMKFEPIANYTHLIIEAFYNTPTLFPYNGNVLIDKASDLVPIPCDQPIAETEPEEKPAPAPAKTPAKTEPKKPATTTTPPKVTTKSPDKKVEPKDVLENIKISDIDRSELKAGSTIRIDNLYFEADKAVIMQNSFTVLDDLYNFLNRNPDVVVEIGGHTNGLASENYANKLSSDRAKAIYEYLVKKGIDKDRLQFKGYGKRNPIATNNTAEGRRKNQRVEVKILSING
ncbi:MAG: OmpA family protein, partial [Saprospiraceae bacterium]